MTEENLLKLKNNYKQFKEANKNLETLLSIKEEMETYDAVKEYKNLLEALETYKKEFPFNSSVMNNDELLDLVMDKETITETNRIYVYQCSYGKLNYGKAKQSRGYYRVAVDDDRAEYHVYLDIEKDYKSAPVEISASERESFEKSNNVIYPENILPFECYMKAKKLFFETAINSSQEEAIQKVLKK